MQVRKHIGLLVPSANSIVEPDFYQALPPTATLHSQHIWSDVDPRRPTRSEKLGEELLQASRFLTPLRLDVLCLPQGNAALEEQFGRIFDIPAIASSPSVLQALRFYGVKRISIVTPFDEWVNSRLWEFFANFAFEVLSAEGDDRMQKAQQQDTSLQDPVDIVEFAVASAHAEAEAIVLSGSAWRAMEVAEEIERITGKLVITSNQATVWRALKKVGVSETRRGFGRLLREMPPIADATQPNAPAAVLAAVR